MGKVGEIDIPKNVKWDQIENRTQIQKHGNLDKRRHRNVRMEMLFITLKTEIS